MGHKNHESGFSLVEVVVAMAIVGGLIVGIGALLAGVGQLGSRARASSAILEALLEVNALRSLAGVETAVIATEPSATGFVLQPVAAQGGVEPSRFRLATESSAGRLDFTTASTSATVDLSAFETISIEYFSPADQTSFWDATPASDSDVQGARLVLRSGDRVWRPLVWMRSELL